MLHAIVTVGISASGKSTWAREFVTEKGPTWHIVCRDDIRMQMLNERTGIIVMDGVRWNLWKWKDEGEVTRRYWEQVEKYSTRGQNVILADTNLNQHWRNELIWKLGEYGYAVEIKEFSIEFDEALKRDAERPYGVGVSVLAKQWQQWIEYQGTHMRYERDLSKRSAVMVDIDGTLAHMDNSRSPYDWHKVDNDRVDIAVAELVRAMFDAGHVVIVMSGRDGSCFELTQNWLRKHHIPHHALHMRNAGDMRKDAIVKRELFDNHVRNQYNVLMVIDDRPQVCDMWRDLGLQVLQCGNPYMRF